MNCTGQEVDSLARMVVLCVEAQSFPWPLVTAAVALAGIVIALRTSKAALANARLVARVRATLDLIEKVEATPHYRDLISTFSYYRRQKAFDRLHDPKEEREKADRQKVLSYLNHYELVAIGIKSAALDKDFYAQWMKPVYVRDWNAAADFIQRERWKLLDSDGKNDRKFFYHDDIFCEFQNLAREWGKCDATHLDANIEGPPEDPSGPGDESLPDVDGQNKAPKD